MQLSFGVRVMLRRNFWVTDGLVNGALSTVRAIVYAHGENPPALPMYVLVEFDEYAGPFICGELFPVTPTEAEWRYQSMTFTRTQIPLTLAHAVSIHKCQGLTLGKVVIDIGPTEFASGLAYVALFRPKTLADVIFQAFYNRTRFNASSSKASHKYKQDFVHWLETIR